MFQIDINDMNVFKFKYTIVDAPFACFPIDIDKSDFEIDKYIVVPYMLKDLKMLILTFASTSTVAYLSNRFNNNRTIPFPVGRVRLDGSSSQESAFLLGNGMCIFNDEYELYSWIVELMQLFEEVRFYEYSHCDTDHIIRPIELISQRLDRFCFHSINKNDVPFLGHDYPIWEIHKKMKVEGNEDNVTNGISNKYDDLPTIKLTKKQFNGESTAEFFSYPYFNEEDNEWIIAWYPKTYTCFKGSVNIWKRLKMDGKYFILQLGNGYLPKYMKTVKTVEMFEARFFQLFKRINAKDMTEVKHVMVSHDGGIMGKISGKNLRDISRSYYDPKDDPDAGIVARMLYGKD